jgi:hypothetical protein
LVAGVGVGPGPGGGQPTTARPAAASTWIEQAFNGFRHWRGFATEYDKRATVYRGARVLAASLIWLTNLGDTLVVS